MRQTREEEQARRVGEKGVKTEDLQGTAIGWRHRIPGILYGGMFDISEVDRWENVDVF